MYYLSTLDHLVNDLFGPVYKEIIPTETNLNNEVLENEKGFNITLAIPGFSKDDLNINFLKDSLEINGEVTDSLTGLKKSYDKAYQLPDNVDVKNIKAHLENGLLRIFIPKVEMKEQKQSVEIHTGQSSFFKKLIPKGRESV